MSFVDFTKAFDSILHEQMLVAMTEMGYPAHIIILLTYWQNCMAKNRQG